MAVQITAKEAAKAQPPLFRLRIAEAKRVKWEAGRRAYGGDAFVGDPMAELYAELIDGLNYCDEARRQGIELGAIPDVLRDLTEDLRAMLRTPETVGAHPQIAISRAGASQSRLFR